MVIEPDSVSTQEVRADLALVQAILKRDRKATADFVQLYSDSVYSFVWKRLAPRSDATDDLVQEIFLSAWSSLDTYSGAAPLRNWLLSIARHKVQDYYRRTLREAAPAEERDLESPPDVETIEDILDQERMAAKAAELMSRLRYDYALLLRWRYWDQLSARQMAEETGRTEKAIERMLARARDQFRRLWTGKEGDADGEDTD